MKKKSRSDYIKKNTTFSLRNNNKQQLFVILYVPVSVLSILHVFFRKKILFLFSERGEGREKTKERNINVWLPFTRPQLGTRPTTQTCTLTGNRTSNLLVQRPALNPLSHTSQGSILYVLTHSSILIIIVMQALLFSSPFYR